MTILEGNKRFVECRFKSEEEFEELIRSQSKMLFGENTIFVTTKRKLSGLTLGATIPDGFLFDMTDVENPEFYLVEVELHKHDFYRHIFPQITKFFGFFRNAASQADLVEKLFAIINTDNALKNDFKKFLGQKEIYKFLKDTCEDSQNILLVIDGDKDELPEIQNTYTDTWGKLVKILKVKKFTSNSEALVSVEPDFVELQFAPDTEPEEAEAGEDQKSKPTYTEEYHLDGVSEFTKRAYLAIKNHIEKEYHGVVLNPQKYYIGIRKSRNLAYIKFRKKKLRVVVMLPEAQVRTLIAEDLVKPMSQSNQDFYNGPSCFVILQKEHDVGELLKLLKSLIK